MQKKKLFITILLCLGLINISYSQDPDLTMPKSTEYKAPENIAFVLLKLVNNEIKMEKYSNKEFNLTTNVMNTQKSSDHCIMTIDMKERGLSPQTVAWDDDKTGKIDISAGRNKKLVYSMNLENIFHESDGDVIAVCFDCTVKRQKDKESKEWKSQVSVILPIKVDSTKIEFIFDEKIKAACGFFMGNQDFEKLIGITGNIAKKEALEVGLLYISSQKSDESEETTNNQTETTPEPETSDTIVVALENPETPDKQDDIPDAPTNEEIASSEPETIETDTVIAEEPNTTVVAPEPEIIEAAEPQSETVMQENSAESSVESETEKQSVLAYVFDKIKNGATYVKDAIITKLIALKQIVSNVFGYLFGRK